MKALFSALLLGLAVGVSQQTAKAQTAPEPPPLAPDQLDKSLSDWLGRNKGVIKPPEVEDEMEVKPPDTQSKMPVIPPPGSPGGDESVEPR